MKNSLYAILNMEIKKNIIEAIVGHAKKDAPLEACGYLAGRESVVTASYPLVNIDSSSEHFSFDPKEQFAVMKDARSKGLSLYAVYHSHPQSPARPSEEDKELAHDPGMLYVIVSLALGREDVKAFKIGDGVSEEIKIEVVDNDRI